MSKRYEADQINGLGYQTISSAELRAVLARFNLSLRNIGKYGLRLPCFGNIRSGP